MTTLEQTSTGQDQSVEHTIQQLRELYATRPRWREWRWSARSPR